MKIICAGLGKTGTKSITKALRHLGFVVFDWEEQTFDFLDHWVDVFKSGAQPDVKRVYQNADAVVDFPGTFFWEEILEAFPESKVILSEREEVSWIKSAVNQLINAVKSREFYRMLSPTARKMNFVLYSYRILMLFLALQITVPLVFPVSDIVSTIIALSPSFHQGNCWSST